MMISMRRKHLEIKDIDKIAEILNKINTIHIGINNQEYPLIFPLSFGFEVIDDKISIYFHGGFQGLRYELLKKDNHVCIEAELFSKYKKTNTSATANYDSIIGFGEAIELTDDNERLHGLKLLVKHCGFENLDINQDLFKHTAVFKVKLKEISCKSNHQ